MLEKPDPRDYADNMEYQEALQRYLLETADVRNAKEELERVRFEEEGEE